MMKLVGLFSLKSGALLPSSQNWSNPLRQALMAG